MHRQGLGAPCRPVGGRPRDLAPGERGASDLRPAERIRARHPQHRAGGASGLPRARDRADCLWRVRPRVADRGLATGAGFARRLPPPFAALPGRCRDEEPRRRRRDRPRGARLRNERRAIAARLGAGARRGYRSAGRCAEARPGGRSSRGVGASAHTRPACRNRTRGAARRDRGQALCPGADDAARFGAVNALESDKQSEGLMKSHPLVALAVTGAVCLSLTACGDSVLAREVPAYTAQAVADRAAIEDLLTRYYNNFGAGAEHTKGQIYAPDGEMILGPKTYKGIKENEWMYASVPADAPQKKSFALNILINIMLVTVHGQTATARLVFTETITEKQGDAPKILTQGREFDNLVKRGGKWLIAKRQIMGANGMPDSWQE